MQFFTGTDQAPMDPTRPNPPTHRAGRPTVLILRITMAFLLSLGLSGDEAIRDLERKLPTARGADRVHLLAALGDQFMAITEYEKAEPYYREAVDLSRKLGDPKLQVSATVDMAVFYRNRGDLPEALVLAREAVRDSLQAKGNPHLDKSQSTLGTVLHAMGDGEGALNHFLDALRLAEANGDRRKIAVAKVNAASVYVDMKLFRQALDYLDQGLVLFTERGEQNLQAAMLTNMALCHVEMGELEKALELNLRALGLHQTLNSREGIAHNFRNLSAIHLKAKKYALSAEIAEKALRTSQSTGDKQGVALSELQLGEALLHLGKAGEGIERADRARVLAKSISADQLELDALKLLAEAQAAAGGHESAFETLNKHMQMKEAVQSAESKKRMANLQARFEVDRKEKEIALLKKDQELQVTRQRRQLALVLAGGLLAIVLVGFLVHNAKVRARAAKLIEAKNLQLLEAQQSLEDAARTDPLTGLENRRGFQEKLDYHVNLFDRSKRPFSLVMGDIDYFKKVNDHHGHEAGDLVLKQVAGLLEATLRVEDSVCRWGGEEFLVLLPETDSAGALRAAEKLRKSVEALVIVHGARPLPVTMTFGVNTFYGGDLQGCIRGADLALYQGKNDGRNRVVVASG